ncbi:MAG: methionyl-tRNA formyltransferase [Candidatus Omnitrophica bacterium]|nr:methionyl-tRNA formyltransferase [Candidatus Omnitrophota bacterium]
MNSKSVAVLTSKGSWFLPYARQFVATLKNKRLRPGLFYDHRKIDENYKIVFILNYTRLIGAGYLRKHKHNLVVHESDLPKGKGWAPLFWQVLEGKNVVPIVLFDANEKIDDGDLYLKDYIKMKGHELNSEIREKQARKTLDLCLRFLTEYKRLRPEKQKGKSTFYKRRKPVDSALDMDKTLKEQFNLLRIVNNKRFPAFFRHKGYKYTLKIRKEKCSGK